MSSLPRSVCLIASILCFLEVSLPAEEVLLPKFEFQGVALHPDDLKYKPTDQLIHPAIIKTDHIKEPLGKYYMYYAPHKHIATSMAYADTPGRHRLSCLTDEVFKMC